MTHDATLQPDLCEQLTPATVIVWLRRKAAEKHGEGNDLAARSLAMAAATVERHVLGTGSEG